MYGMPLTNKKIFGLIKDENNSINDRIELRARMNGRKDTKKVKSINSNIVVRTITFDDYVRCLKEEIEMTRRIYDLITRGIHDIRTSTLPWGHWRISL